VRRFLLDTTPIAAYLNDRPAAVQLIRPWVEQREVATSILDYAEVVEYIKSFSDFELRHMQLRRLLRDIYPYFLTYSILERYADIRRQLRPPYGPGLIGDMDTLIAATAIQQGLTLVTVDSDFERVPNLDLMLISIR
jgi:predicted nucleic acid-binding protein